MSSLTFPENITYTKEHTWLKEDGSGKAFIGISDFAQEQLSEVAFVDLPAVGKSFNAMAEFGTVESIKAVNALFMPIAGKVIAVNEELESETSLVNTSPYEEGWMIQIEIAPDADRSHLLCVTDYKAQLG